MENGNSNFLSCFSIGICFMLLLSTTNAEDKTEPRKNANLSPFESWRSAYFCLMNHSKSCSGDNTLTLNGTIVVKEWQVYDFCNGGCYHHTLDVLNCIRDVKRHGFQFETTATLDYVQIAMDKACNANSLKGFNTSYKKPSSATSLYGKLYMPIASTLTTLALMAPFGADRLRWQKHGHQK